MPESWRNRGRSETSGEISDRERCWRDALVRIAYEAPANPAGIAFEALRKHRPTVPSVGASDELTPRGRSDA